MVRPSLHHWIDKLETYIIVFCPTRSLTTYFMLEICNIGEHITITCHVLSTLNQEHDLLEVQTVLPDIITILMEPRMLRSLESFQAHTAVVSLLEELIVYQFLPASQNILQILLMDSVNLLSDLLDAIYQQELRSLVTNRRQAINTASFTKFFSCELQVVSETSKIALSNLDLSHQSKNIALLVGLLNLISKLLPHSSSLNSSNICTIWTLLHRSLAHFSPILVDSEPTLAKIIALDSTLRTTQAVLKRSFMPSATTVSRFVSELLQTSLLAAFTTHPPAVRASWRSTYDALTGLLNHLSGSQSFSLTAFPGGFVPTLTSKLTDCTDIGLFCALLNLFHSRIKHSFISSITWMSLQNSLPSLLDHSELRFTVRLFAKSLHDWERRNVINVKQINSSQPKLTHTPTKRFDNESPFSPPSTKRPKLSEVDIRSPIKYGSSITRSNEPSFSKLMEILASMTNQLFTEASQAIKSNRPIGASIELETKALNAAVTLIRVQMDTLEIRASTANSRRKKNASNSQSSSQSLSNLLHFKLSQRSDIDQLTNGILVTARLVADFLVERLTPPKISPLVIFSLGGEFLDSMIDLMTILPPHDIQLPGATVGILGHLCEVSFSALPSAHSAIQRPSLFPMPTGDARSIAQANAQLDRSPEVTLFAEKALVLATLMSYRSSESHLCSAALSDPRTRVTHASLRHFALFMAKFGETTLSNGDAVYTAFQTASTLCKSLIPLPTTLPISPDVFESVETLCHFAKGIACLMQLERFGEDSGDEFRCALVRVNDRPCPRFEFVCCKHCAKSSKDTFFWKVSSSKTQIISSMNFDWSGLVRLFAQYRNEKIDPKLRLMLLDAHKSVFHHCLLPQAKSRNAAKNTSPPRSNLRSTSRLSPTSMNVDAQTTSTNEPALSTEIALEIASLFELAVNGPTAELSSAASDAIVSLIEPEAEKGKSVVNNAILNEMSNATASLNRSSSQPQAGSEGFSETKIGEEALLRLVGKIGGHAKGWYVLPPLFLLLNYLTDLRVSIKACAYENLVRLSNEHGVTPRELLKQYEPKIGVHLAKSLRKPGPLLEEVCLTILDVDPVEYLMSFFNVLLPKIALKKDKDLLELVAKRTNKSAPSILLDSMTPILVAAVCKPNIPFEIVEFVVEKVKITAGELFTRYMKGILLGVVLRLGDKSKKRIVINSMDLLVATLRMSHAPSSSQSSASKRRSSRGSEASHSISQQYNSREDLIAANFLQISNRLVYEHILKPSAPFSTRLNALYAYKRLIGFLGSHIDKFYVIIGSVLRLTMTEVPELRSATCKAWKSFLKHVPDRCLGPILGATTVYLLSYDAYEADIVPILEYLFITKESVLKPYFRDVPLLPDRPALSRVHTKWREAQSENNSSSSGIRSRESSLRPQLSQLILLARNDDCSIREMALKQLINFLHLHRCELAQSMQREQGIDSVVVDLVELLVNGSRESVPSVRSKFAQALGELGAIDPSRLANKLPPSVTVPVLDHSEEQFAADLIENYLVKTYRTARLVSNQDRACFTIQEVLAYFDCDTGTATRNFSEQRRDTVLWSKLTPETRALVHPFLASQYILNRPDRWLSSSQLPASAAPISAYQHGMPYAIWLEHWLERLIVDSKSGLFQACIGILSTHDLDTAHYILPHIVLSILHNGSKAAQKSILHEMLVVLGARAPSDGRNTLQPQRVASLESINSMAAQRIFSLIDALYQWVESKYAQFRERYTQWTTDSKENANDPTSQPKVDPRVANVETLLSEIPQLAVCKTALSINAYSRALMHFEKANREGSSPKTEKSAGIPPLKPIVETSEIALIQRIFTSFDDPDALEGITHLKPSGKSFSDIIESYRAAGRWNETLIALDQLVRQKNSDPEALTSLQCGRLECLAELGLFDQLLNLASSCMNDPIMSQHDKYLQKVRSYGAHAAWKLGDWKTIESLLGAHAKQSGAASYQMFAGNFDLAIGQIFLALRNKKRTQFENVLLVMRNDIIQPLGAASLESYDRAYPMIVKLQMLNELEDSWKLLYGVDGNDGAGSLETVAPNILPYGRDASNPINVSITHPDNLDKSIGGLIQGKQLNNSMSVMDSSTVQAVRSSPNMPLQGTMSLSDRTLNERAKILQDWNVRLSLTQYSYKVRESILSLRLAVFGMADMHKEATDTWLQLAQMARKTSKFTMAQYAILHLREGAELRAALESSKLLWASGDHAKALVEVEKLVEQGAALSASTAAGSDSSTDTAETSKTSAEISRQRLMEARQNSGPIAVSQSSATRSKSSLSRQNSSSVGKLMSDKDILSSAKLLKARWMLDGQYAVQSVQAAFRESMSTNYTVLLMKTNYYNGLFSDHLCTEYKRKLYSLPPKPVVQKSSKRGSATSSKSTSAPTTAAPLPPMLTQQAQQYWLSIRHAFSSLTYSLVRSTAYCYQILPRLVSMWFEISEALQDLFVQYPDSTLHNVSSPGNEPWNLKIPNKKMVDPADKTAKLIVEAYLNTMSLIQKLLNHIPSYAWLISFSLLISGCVHRNKDVEDLIGRIILKVLSDYPQQAIWHIFPLNYSNSEDRKAKYNWIRKQTAHYTFKERDGSQTSLYQFFDEAASLAHQFSILCAHKVHRDKGSANIELRLSDTCQIEQKIPKALIMPSEQQLSCVQFLDASRDSKNPFAYQPVYIRRAHPKVTILRSLARPRKLVLYGSDEQEYWFLCKPVDDLRKDARMMEFNGMVNRLLKKDLETRKRELRIRTYSVLPLSDNSGILNWVPNTNGLRGVISDIYAMDGLDLTEKIRDIRKWYEGNQNKEDWKVQFEEKLLPKFPLALSKWFLQQFPEPSSWLRARTNFARTCGVMSIVGTILGLGDRHCENILVDSKTGDCLHVDLNCIFHKGRGFAIPEVVPFRLTRNMVDAFGITGVEGAFRRACELTMKIMTENKDALLSVLGTFVQDPLLEWSTDSPSASSMTRHATSNPKPDPFVNAYSHERHNKLAVEILNGIADRLDGLMRTPDNLDQLIVPLSVEGYVDAVIAESTSNANLCKMYVGWSSFL